MDTTNHLRIVLVGKTGTGKSSAGNTILGREAFKAAVSFKPVTTECQKAEGFVAQRGVIVVDTPDLFDLKVKNKVKECFSMYGSGPHAFLLVMKLDRFTPEEKSTAEEIQKVFGSGVLQHTMVLFTGGDQLHSPNIDHLIRDCKELKYLLDKVGGRYHVFNNRRYDRAQVNKLLEKLDEIVKKPEGSICKVM